MKIDITSRGFALTPALRDRVETEAEDFHRQFPQAFRTLSVRLYDINGTRGGPDKGCLIHARLGRYRTSVVASEINADLYRAIPAAFSKLERGARSALQRKRAARHLRRSWLNWSPTGSPVGA